MRISAKSHHEGRLIWFDPTESYHLKDALWHNPKPETSKATNCVHLRETLFLTTEHRFVLCTFFTDDLDTISCRELDLYQVAEWLSVNQYELSDVSHFPMEVQKNLWSIIDEFNV
jgi:hypothetical protein